MTKAPETAGETPPDPAREASRRRFARRLGLGVIAAVIVLVAFGAWGTHERAADAEATLGRINETPTVRIMVAKAEAGTAKISLPGTMEPYDAATLFARATGYIASRTADFGSLVKAGDVLAVIGAPDLDQQRAQARAQVTQTQASLDQAQATLKLQTATNARTQTLVAQGWQTKQQGDTNSLTLQADAAAVQVARANLEAQKANLSRLDQLTGFEQVTAPFDGVVTDRQIDVGSLVSADTNSGTPLFSMARSDVMRVQVYVPQDSVFDLHDGTEASVTVPELTDRVFKGKVSRMASALAAGTRTMLIQVDVPNEGNALRPGLYCLVGFDIKRTAQTFTVPSQAVIFNRKGLSVAVVANGKVELRQIELAQDDGASVEVKSGLQAGDQVILSPPVNLTDGMDVKVAAS